MKIIVNVYITILILEMVNGKYDNCKYICNGCLNTWPHCLDCPLNSLRIFSNNLC